MELFAVAPASEDARTKVDRNPANRWLSIAEIRGGRCRDGLSASQSDDEAIAGIPLIEWSVERFEGGMAIPKCRRIGKRPVEPMRDGTPRILPHPQRDDGAPRQVEEEACDE
jgi:hypothetical protein